MSFLKKYLRHYLKDIITGQSFKLVEAVLELLLPLVMAGLIDAISAAYDPVSPVPLTAGQVFAKGGLMLLLAAVGVGTALVCQVTASRASQNFGTELRHDVFEHITRLSPPDLERFGASGLINRVTGDINQLQTALAMLIRLVVRAPFLAIGSIVMAVILDVSLSAVFLVTAPLIALIIFAVMRTCLPYFRLMQDKTDILSRVTKENLSGARVVRAFSRQKEESTKFAEAAESYTDTAVRSGRINALLTPATTLVMDAGIIAVLLLSKGRVAGGLLSKGVVVAFINYLLQILTQTAIVANLITIFTKASASALRVGEVLSAVPSLTMRKEEERDNTSEKFALRFDNVSYTYPGAAASAVRGLSFAIKEGTTCAVIGGTGCGKTTLARLAARSFDAESGRVYLFGKEIGTYPVRDVHRLIGEVPQQARLFSGTIRKNLCLNGEEKSDGFLWDCLSKAQAKDFVAEYPEGLDHKLMAGGKGLSGGQRQRLTVARALAAQPRLLILDDSMSALDMKTEANLRRALRSLPSAVTCLIISQRVSAVRDADSIIVMDDGGISGIGTHSELLEKCDVYREICQSQEEEGKEAAGNEKK